MSGPRSDYWRECVESSFEEHGIEATEVQIQSVADDIRIGQENIGLAFPTPPNPMIEEIDELKRLLREERNKEICATCKGSGRTFGIQCHKCNGEGRRAP